MKHVMIGLLICGGMAMLSEPTFAQSTQQRPETFCYDGSGPAYCARTNEHRYEACANLAEEQGERLGSRGYDRFVYECLTGTIGKEPN